MKKTLQFEAENVAYTMKGLFKTADFLSFFYTSCVFLSFLLGLILLVFQINENISKIIGIFVLLLGMALLKYDTPFQKIDGYRELANEYLATYKDLYFAYMNDKYDNISSIRDSIKILDKRTTQFPIHYFGRIWSKYAIKNEMDFNWLKNE